MLFLHESHQVLGKREKDFEAAYRDGWMPALAATDHARLLWYFDQAHGSGASYTVVTVTAVADGRAWEELTRRVHEGDLRDWAGDLDTLRYASTGKLLQPVYWSPLQDVDLAAVPTDGREHDPSMFMEDTGWPYASLDAYIELWDTEYYQPRAAIPKEQQVVDIEACFQVAYGTGPRPEAMLVQKLHDYDLLVRVLTTRPEYDPEGFPGRYMHRGLDVRDQWESRLLRTSEWSPWF